MGGGGHDAEVREVNRAYITLVGRSYGKRRIEKQT